jgi:hypothetical protein
MRGPSVQMNAEALPGTSFRSLIRTGQHFQIFDVNCPSSLPYPVELKAILWNIVTL